ncbi:MAG: hypothetical protein LIO99_07990 [Clostridiales bacterium]|nr:hypothetical protein [Clostridiales bacterium]
MVTGIRRCGKTFLLFELYHESFLVTVFLTAVPAHNEIATVPTAYHNTRGRSFSLPLHRLFSCTVSIVAASISCYEFAAGWTVSTTLHFF